jgi:hypothetical protein
MNLRKQTRLLEEGNKKSYLGAKSGEERMACTLLVTLRRKGGGGQAEDEVDTGGPAPCAGVGRRAPPTLAPWVGEEHREERHAHEPDEAHPTV